MVNEAIKHFEEKIIKLQDLLDNYDSPIFKKLTFGKTPETKEVIEKLIERYKKVIRSIENDKR